MARCHALFDWPYIWLLPHHLLWYLLNQPVYLISVTWCMNWYGTSASWLLGIDFTGYPLIIELSWQAVSSLDPSWHLWWCAQLLKLVMGGYFITYFDTCVHFFHLVYELIRNLGIVVARNWFYWLSVDHWIIFTGGKFSWPLVASLMMRSAPCHGWLLHHLLWYLLNLCTWFRSFTWCMNWHRTSTSRLLAIDFTGHLLIIESSSQTVSTTESRGIFDDALSSFP